MYKLHFDNFLINEHDDDDYNRQTSLITVEQKSANFLIAPSLSSLSERRDSKTKT